MSLWETYRAFLSSQSEQIYQQEADEPLKDPTLVSLEEVIRALANIENFLVFTTNNRSVLRYDTD